MNCMRREATSKTYVEESYPAVADLGLVNTVNAVVAENGKRSQNGGTVLSDDGALTVAALATDFGVSEVTIRGDLRALEQQGMLVRTRGGARPATLKTILQREKLNVESKARIAQAAAAMVRDDDNVMVEAGTTTAS